MPMAGASYTTGILQAAIYVMLFAAWGFSIGFVFLHASSNNRSTWFWTLVAVFPVVGLFIYLYYFHWKTSSINRMEKARKRERIGEFIAKPKTRKQREYYESIAILANFRDKEVEELLIEGDTDEAMDVIEARMRSVADKEDTVALESYDFYRRAVIEYSINNEIPRIIRKLWDIDDVEEETEAIAEGGQPMLVAGDEATIEEFEDTVSLEPMQDLEDQSGI